MATFKFKNPNYKPGSLEPQWLRLKPIISQLDVVEALDDKLPKKEELNEVTISAGVNPTDSSDIWIDLNGDGYKFSEIEENHRNGILDAPNDGKIYVRKNEGWTSIDDLMYVEKKWKDLNNPPLWFKNALVSYYDPAKLQLTNSQILLDISSSGKGYVELIDYSPNDLNMNLYGLTGDEMNGIGGYTTNFNNWIVPELVEVNYKTSDQISFSTAQIHRGILFEVNNLYNKILKFRVNNLIGAASLYGIGFNLEDSKVLSNLKINEEYYFDFKQYPELKTIVIRSNESLESDTTVALELVALYENAICLNGVSSYGKISDVSLSNLGISKTNGYTIIMERQWLNTNVIDQSVLLTNDNLNNAFALEHITNNSDNINTYSYGNNNIIQNFYPNKSVIVQTSNKYNDLELTYGNVKTWGNSIYLGSLLGTSGFANVAIWKLLIFNRDLSKQEIDWIKYNILNVSDGGKCRELYEAAGAIFNENTGYYELKGVTDITELEIAKTFVSNLNIQLNPPSRQ